MSKSGVPKFLIVCCRYIGDVILTTPIANSIREKFPEADIDYLVFHGTDKALLKNRTIDKIITIPKDGKSFLTAFKLFRKYDIAIAANSSDRNAIFAAIAGKTAIGITNGRRGEFWKHLLLKHHTVVYDQLHSVVSGLATVHLMGLKPHFEVTFSFDEQDTDYARQNIAAERYIVIHPYSMKNCKYWSAANWGKLAGLIQAHDAVKVVFTKTPAPDDNKFLDEILSYSPSDAISFPCTLNQFAAALANATAYIGIDTAATHIASAVGVKTVALYGPSLTRFWAPWPKTCTELSPFFRNKGVQHKDNVTVIQREWDCVPCNAETCAITSRGMIECLEAITPEEVFQEVFRNVNDKHN